MRLKPADLARRLGITRAAVRDAEVKGRLTKDAEGLIDTQAPANREYIRRFSGSRGKHRAGIAPVSPGRAAAMLERAKSEYARRYQDYIERRKGFVPASWVWGGLLFAFEQIRAALPEFVDRIEWDHPVNLQIGMDEAMSWVIQATKRYSWPGPPKAAPPRSPPPEDPGSDLDSVRAARDVLAARRHDLESNIARGFLMSHEDQLRTWLEYVGPAINSTLKYYPRRAIASFLAVEYSQGRDAAVEWLRLDVGRECSRLDDYISRLKEKLA